MQTAALRCAQVRAQVRENHVHYQRDITKELQELEAFENHVLYERNMATRAKMRCNIVRLLKLVKWSNQPDFVRQAWGILKSHVSKFKLQIASVDASSGTHSWQDGATAKHRVRG